MGYHSVVCVKQVPDTSNVTGDTMKPDGTVNRAALPAIFNPDDLYALEAAVNCRDAYGGSVTALTMGPLGAAEVLRECLYRGADRGVLITDRRAAASDTLATSYILAQAIRKLETFDFVFCGRQAIDGDTAQVGPQIAEKLGIAQVTYFERFMEVDGRTVRVRRNVGNGWEVLEARLPLLLTVLDTAAEHRPASARRVMQLKYSRTIDELRKEVDAAMRGESEEEREIAFANRAEELKMQGQFIEQWSLDDIGADLQWCGLAGSPTKVHRVQSIVLTKEGFTEIAPTGEAIRKMIHELIVDHTLG